MSKPEFVIEADAVEDGQLILTSEDIAGLFLEMKSRVESNEEQIARLRAEVDQKDEQISELKSAVEDHDTRMAAFSNWLESTVDTLEEVKQQTATHDDTIRQIQEEISTVQTDLIEEQKTRSQHDSKAEGKINLLATELGIDDIDTQLVGDDKVARLVRNGPEDVTDRVYEWHKRARYMLTRGREWGDIRTTRDGTVLVFTSPDVKNGLEDRYGREFQYKQVLDMFGSLEHLGDNSPRTVRKRKDKSGVTTLSVGLLGEGDPVWEAVN